MEILLTRTAQYCQQRSGIVGCTYCRTMHIRNVFARSRFLWPFHFQYIFLTHFFKGESFGENLEAIGEILAKTLDTSCDAESRLRIFVALSTALDEKDIVFKNASNLNGFLETLISG